MIAESERITEITFLENRIREGMEVIKNVNTKWYHHETEAVLSASLTRMDEKKSPDKTVKQSTSLYLYYFVNSRMLRSDEFCESFTVR